MRFSDRHPPPAIAAEPFVNCPSSQLRTKYRSGAVRVEVMTSASPMFTGLDHRTTLSADVISFEAAGWVVCWASILASDSRSSIESRRVRVADRWTDR